MPKMTNENDRRSPKPKLFEILNLIAAFCTAVLCAYGISKGYHLGFTVILILLTVFLIVNSQFIKDKRNGEGMVEKKLAEKETLLKEVHHRVKNNLQTVSSLLGLQSRTMEDPKISNIIKSSQNRVVSMAMVHEMLYKRDDYSSKIELKPYVEELTEYLIRSLKGNVNQIKTHLDIGDFKLSIDTVIPLGLIINETVTNALKYGIPDTSSGEIRINLEKKGVNTYEMYLGDNGIGFPEDIDPKNSKSLGLKLIHNLARQLKGSVARDPNKKGTYYQINFEEVIDDFNAID